MKATVQYNDFIGTSAADVSDFQNLIDYMRENRVDTNRYCPIGIEFYAGNTSNRVSFHVICIDNQSDKTKAVKIGIEIKTIQEVIDLFKRLNIILTQKDYADYELVDEPVMRGRSLGI